MDDTKIVEADLGAIEEFKNAREKILKEIRKVIIGQQQIVDEILIAMFSRGHCLVVGVPGLAKTLMVNTIAQVMDLKFKRIQFTPDLMPSDITGTDIMEEDSQTHKRSFKFIEGPIFANIVLADEINRTPPKTQAALLEAMQEYKVTAGGVTYPLELPFFILATQNPIEQEGTYPLPEAQLDRFMFNINIDYPSKTEEQEIVKSTTYETNTELTPVLDGEKILELQRITRRIPVSDHVVIYATNIVRASRPKDASAPEFIKDWVSWGAGPRAAQYLILGAKARAITRGDYNVSCEDVRSVAAPVLRHRIIINFNAEAEGIDSEKIIEKLLNTITEPTEKDYAKLS